MLKYVVLLGLLVIMGVFVSMAYPKVLNGAWTSAVGPAAIPATVYHSLAQHIPKIPTRNP